MNTTRELDKTVVYKRGERFTHRGLEYVVGVKPWRKRQRVSGDRLVEVRAGELGYQPSPEYGVSIAVRMLLADGDVCVACRVERNVEVRSASTNKIGGQPCYEDAWLSPESVEAVVALLVANTAALSPKDVAHAVVVGRDITTAETGLRWARNAGEPDAQKFIREYTERLRDLRAEAASLPAIL